MKDNDRRIIYFRFNGSPFVMIEVEEGFEIFKNFAEDREVVYNGDIVVIDEDPFYYIDFYNVNAVDRFINDMHDM